MQLVIKLTSNWGRGNINTKKYILITQKDILVALKTIYCFIIFQHTFFMQNEQVTETGSAAQIVPSLFTQTSTEVIGTVVIVSEYC